MRPGGRVAIGLAALVVGCGPAAVEPPPRVGREDAVVHLSRIGKTWARLVDDQGILRDDPNGVVSFHVREEMAFVVVGKGEPHRSIAREETFALAGGGEARCRVDGVLPLVVRAYWHEREVRVAFDSPGGRLPRRCSHGVFPVKTRDVGRWTAVYALRDDRLVPLEPPTLREPLLPQ